ncbi:polyribonucleotide nucleotidyltransferase [Liquorilactobacillus oeni DSM 19972]|uniref:Polyribonucleotide nucleotidyltransferase n=2 Tax=Liquorilactobacillus oeni TaxID=303241 RepID=A0A0R1MFZ9_9LACO|nr:polyribonucleotide nucleotidyltransferase [Liquorilactobacillus oeni DSM 19972]
MTVVGKVTGIQPYGAFVSLDDHIQGLIHISECHHGFVADIHKFLKTDQKVKVMIIDIDEYSQKISLSVRCLEKPFVLTPEPFVRCEHKHYWTNRKINEGFKPIQIRLDGWMKKALVDMESDNLKLN